MKLLETTREAIKKKVLSNDQQWQFILKMTPSDSLGEWWICFCVCQGLGKNSPPYSQSSWFNRVIWACPELPPPRSQPLVLKQGKSVPCTGLFLLRSTSFLLFVLFLSPPPPPPLFLFFPSFLSFFSFFSCFALSFFLFLSFPSFFKLGLLTVRITGI